MHSEAVSGHFPIYLRLGVYGHGTCLHSLHGGGAGADADAGAGGSVLKLTGKAEEVPQLNMVLDCVCVC